MNSLQHWIWKCILSTKDIDHQCIAAHSLLIMYTVLQILTVLFQKPGLKSTFQHRNGYFELWKYVIVLIFFKGTIFSLEHCVYLYFWEKSQIVTKTHMQYTLLKNESTSYVSLVIPDTAFFLLTESSSLSFLTFPATSSWAKLVIGLRISEIQYRHLNLYSTEYSNK